jgi:hypothetical protein
MNQSDYEKQFNISVEILKDWKPVHVANYTIFTYAQIFKCLEQTLNYYVNTIHVNQFENNKLINNDFKFRICGDFKINDLE